MSDNDEAQIGTGVHQQMEHYLRQLKDMQEIQKVLEPIGF